MRILRPGSGHWSGSLAEKAGEENGGERKKLYLLTPLGRRVVALESERLERLSRWGRELLSREG